MVGQIRCYGLLPLPRRERLRNVFFEMLTDIEIAHALLGRQSGFKITIRDLRLSNGAGFVVVYAAML